MMNFIKIVLFFGVVSISYSYQSQVDKTKPTYKIDTIINTDIYKSYFNYKCKEPVFVVYKLYKGGGDCKREAFSFINDTKISTATDKDYAKSGYDKGHLANSEDFANNCGNDELTFRYYNCVPQTPNLNRGTWKKWETKIRQESQSDSLLIVTGSFYKTKKIGTISVPSYCWKVVQSLSTNKLTHILLFANTDSAFYKTVPISKIENELGYKLPIKGK